MLLAQHTAGRVPLGRIITAKCLIPFCAVPQVTYLAWAMETVPRDIYDDCHLYQVGISVLCVLQLVRASSVGA